MNGPLLECCFGVHYHEVDQQGMVRLPVVMTWLQDAGIDHALELGVAVRDLRKLGLTWVLSRLTLELERFPRGGQQVTVRTWPVTCEGLFSIRDYQLLDADGQQIGQATTSWAVLDLKTRRPVRISDQLPPYPLRPLRALADPFATLPMLEQCSTALQLPVLRADLDPNRHVNNTVYAAWALEAVPSGIADSCQPVRLEIGFRAEALYGDTIRSCCAALPDDPHTLLHRIEHAGDGRELCRLRTTWKPLAQP
ncbi:MAG: acyl-ACP thioesterase domain-containing protein [Trichlorobacter sp.]